MSGVEDLVEDRSTNRDTNNHKSKTIVLQEQEGLQRCRVYELCLSEHERRNKRGMKKNSI